MELDSIPGLLSRQPTYGEGDFKPPPKRGGPWLFLAGFACGAMVFAAGTSVLPPDACGWAGKRSAVDTAPAALASPAVGAVSADAGPPIEPGPDCAALPTTCPRRSRGCDNLSHRKSRLKSSKIEIGRFHQLLTHLTRENRT